MPRSSGFCATIYYCVIPSSKRQWLIRLTILGVVLLILNLYSLSSIAGAKRYHNNVFMNEDFQNLHVPKNARVKPIPPSPPISSNEETNEQKTSLVNALETESSSSSFTEDTYEEAVLSCPPEACIGASAGNMSVAFLILVHDDTTAKSSIALVKRLAYPKHHFIAIHVVCERMYFLLTFSRIRMLVQLF